MEDLKALTTSVCEVARRAGRYIEEERTKFHTESVERKHAHDYVSYVDKASEKLIVESLKALLPEAGFITEEGTATRHEEEYCWVVDPLDGTTNFIHNYAPYCVSIALCKGKEILMGVVYEVTTGECFYAWKDGGAYCNEKPLKVGRNDINDALLCLQLPYNSEVYRPVAQRLIGHFYGHVASVRMSGSAAMSLCYVAAGRLDGYAEKFIGQWDFMAGACIVKEAGGKVTDYDGDDYFMEGDSVVATNGKIHQELLEGIKASM
ncbi:MAG: inositol monophosphatase [Prevotella sp.]|nr:inositol monophosphatase [Prevotella sp.]